ncbi:MAG: MFS transporter, partial [Planktomarina sp.]
MKPPRRAVPVESWRPVALLVATGVVAAFQIGKIPLSLNYLQSDFGFDLVMAGWVASLFAVMGAVCAVLLSFTLSVFGLKPMLLSGLMISMCASLLGGMTPDVSWLLVTRAFEGLGFILCVLCLPPLIGQLAPKGQASAAMAYWAMYLPLGTCVMLLISAVILPIFSWRVVWGASAIALLGMAWLIARLDVQQKDFCV